MLYALARPLLFALDPETAHLLTLALADAPLRFGLLRARVPPCPVRVMGLEFPNPVGLAAGLDKNAEYVNSLARLGFGFIEVGTVTPRPQPGNARPRMFRLPAASAVINRLGFNNVGADAFVENLRRIKWRGILGVNIGKNFDTPNERAADDYVVCLERVWACTRELCDGQRLSPNTAGFAGAAGKGCARGIAAATPELRERPSPTGTAARVRARAKCRRTWRRRRSPTSRPSVRRHRVSRCADHDEHVASREGVEGLLCADEAGGPSGAPIRERATRVLAAFATALQGEVALIGAGGILRGEDAQEKFAAGALRWSSSTPD
jgi:dihydroorotate dehydrogenase